MDNATLARQVRRVLAGPLALLRGSSSDVRCGNDDLRIDKVLVELGALTLLVGGGDKSVTLLLNPLPDTKLVLSGT